jgi:DNA invertase Pin-like site-specific DNA recombinase
MVAIVVRISVPVSGRSTCAETREPLAARAVIYTRPQRNDKGQLIDDHAQQLERCERYARDNGYRVILVLNEDEFGPEDERPELKRMRTTFWKREADVLITPKPDTLYLDNNRLVRLMKELTLVDGFIEFVDVDIDEFMFDTDEY